MIHVFATQLHYLDHMDPIWYRVPMSDRGTCTSSAERLREVYQPGDLVLVAAGSDTLAIPEMPKVYVEHGAGQSYPGDYRAATSPFYSGGADRHRNVAAYLCPRADVAARWGDVPTVVVGCPKLTDIERRPIPRTMVLAFHFDATVCPESRSAWNHWFEHLPLIKAWAERHGWKLHIHEHPRWHGEVIRQGKALGIPAIESGNTVLRRAELLIMDNSSLMYEAAALGVPVVALNAPWYRKDVEHGLRFWSHVPGFQADHVDDLVSSEPDVWITASTATRIAAADYAYDVPREEAAERAAGIVRDMAAWL